MNLDLRPLSIAELLDRSISIYRRHFVLCVGIMAVPSAFLLLTTLPINVLTHGAPTVANAEAAVTPQQAVAVLALIGAYFLGLALYLVAYMFALGATAIAVSDLHAGVAPSISQSYTRIRPHTMRLLMLMLQVGIRLTLAFIAIPAAGFAVTALLMRAIGPFSLLFGIAASVVGGVITVLLTLRYSMTVPSLVLEGLTARAAIRRSIQLSRGNLGRAFLVMFAATVIGYAAMLLFQGPFLVGSLLAGPDGALSLFLTLAGTVFGTLGTTLVAPVMIVGLVVLYFDARVRGEALDVQVLLESAARADAQPAPAFSPSPTPR